MTANPTTLAEPGVAARRLAPPRRYTLSIDTGGTFTDGFVSDAERSLQVKVDTTPHDLTLGFRACVEAAAEAAGEPLPAFLAALETLHFSSTIATNTIVERRGAPVGLIVTAGAEEDLYGERDALAAFVRPELIRGVPERVGDDGAVVAGPDEAALETAVRELLERGSRLLVISFANAHVNPANELAARALIDRSYPRHYLGAVPLMISSRISLAPTDRGRTAVALVNAYLHPNLVQTLYRAEDQARASGLSRPLLIVNTDGSSSRVAKTRAIDTYNSGPSAGVLGAGYVARALGARDVCTFDVGGTTTDVAYLRDGEVPRDAATEVGPASVPHPSVSLWSFGLGGGSIIDGGRVGPESAGSAPGPACFGLGGTALTPTDVWLLLGYLKPGEFLGGRRTLDRDRARAALGGRDPLEALHAVHATLARELREWARRHPPLDDGWLFSYGGGGGLLCVPAAEALGIPRVVVFPHSSVFSAFGGGLLPIAHSYEGELADLVDRARRDLRAEGVTDLALVEAEWDGGTESLLALLDSPPPGRGRLRVSVPREVRLEVFTQDAPRRSRTVLTADGPLEVPVVGGLGRPGAEPAEGPAFLEAPDTTILVPAGWSVRFTDQGYGVLEAR
ncbi:MAG TPA: hydantoinase/oxoprolinase family protein [Conexibacter sp.]|jgi:N-methylhydantoinase A/acetophenone carboxylase